MEKVGKYEMWKTSLGDLGDAELVINCGTFVINDRVMQIPAFKKNEKEYVIHFMPNQTGIWSYTISWKKKTITGEFECVEAADSQHGPVVVKGDGFAYADGSRYIPFGTTCYA